VGSRPTLATNLFNDLQMRCPRCRSLSSVL